jgi:hypothetical protein
MINKGVQFAIVCTLLVFGCSTVPPLREDGIAISEIVQRTKCEIAFAVPEPQLPYPSGPYQWMSDWTAKVDLTLVTNAQSAVTPTAILTKFLPKVTVPQVGDVGRSITLGLGAGASTTAVRTEVLSYSLSLRELREWKKRGRCDLPDGFDLYGNLGLNEWVTSALAPVEMDKLRTGRHPPPSGKSPPPPPVLPRPFAEVLEACGPQLLQPLLQHRADIDYFAGIAEKATDVARDTGDKDKIQATYDQANIVYGVLRPTDRRYQEAQKIASKLKISCPALASTIDTVIVQIKAAATRVAAAKGAVDKIIEALPHDPPIDSLSHSVQFVVALSGNLTPSWTLVNFKGPGASGNLLAGSYTTTHTLAISMGSPSALPSEQSRQLQNLVIIQNLGQK